MNAADRDFADDGLLPNVLLPDQRRHSILTSAKQELSPSVRLSFDGLYSDRRSSRSISSTPGSLNDIRSRSSQFALFGGLDADVGDEWSTSTTLGYSRVNIRNDVTGTAPSYSSPETSLLSGDVGLSGSLFDIPGGAIRLALGGHLRRERFEISVDNPSGASGSTAERDVEAAYAELLIPVVRPNEIRLVRRLEVNLSGRYEHYSDFGSTFNPKVGVLWEPLQHFRLRASYGTSFNPPDLGRLNALDIGVSALTNDFLNAALNFPVEVPSSTTILTVFGTDPELEAEESRGLTAGFELDVPSSIGAVTLKGTVFDIRYRNRIDDPLVPSGVFNSVNLFLSDPSVLPPGLVTANPGTQAVESLIARAQAEAGFTNLFGHYTGPSSVGYIVNFVTGNRARTFVRGVDVGLDVQRDTSAGAFGFSLSGTHLFHLRKQNSAAAELIDVVDTVYNPADLKLRSGLSWSKGGLSAALFGNYIDSYTDDRGTTDVKIASWTTFDLTLGWELRHVRLDLAVSNLFDEGPPRVASSQTFALLGYDPTNASPLGRFALLRATKRW